MELSPSQGHESTSVTLGEFIADSVAASLRSGGGMPLGTAVWMLVGSMGT